MVDEPKLCKKYIKSCIKINQPVADVVEETVP
jgi:hypothetical protein